MKLDRGEHEMEGDRTEDRESRRGREPRRKPRNSAREKAVRERKLLRLDVLNIEAEGVSRCDAQRIADSVYDVLLGRAARESNSRSGDSDGRGESEECWLVSSELTVITYGNGTTGTCRVDTYECDDGSSYTTKTPLS